MPFTNAEKQQRYRERPLGVEGKKARVLLFLSVTARARLNRLARHEGGAVTGLIEELAAKAERRISGAAEAESAQGVLRRLRVLT